MQKPLWITYAWKDNVEQDFDYLAQVIEKAGIRVKFDRIALVPGQRLWQQIGDQISADCLSGWAFLVTPNSLASQPCREELEYAVSEAINKDSTFPLVGLIHGVPFKELPKSLSTRLCCDLRDSNWIEAVRSAIQKRPPVPLVRDHERFKLVMHPDLNGKKVIEVRTRFEDVQYWRFAFPAAGPQPQTVGVGPAGSGNVSGGLRDFIEGRTTLENVDMTIWGAYGPVTPAASGFAIFDDSLPESMAFGSGAGPVDLAHGWQVMKL